MPNNNVAFIYFQREVAHIVCTPSEQTLYTQSAHLLNRHCTHSLQTFWTDIVHSSWGEMRISLHPHFQVIAKQRHVCKILIRQHYGPQECHYIDRKIRINSLDETAASSFRLQEGHPPWRWMQLVLPKQWYVSIKVHSEISQKTVILTFNA